MPAAPTAPAHAALPADAVVRVDDLDDLDDLIERYHQAIHHELPEVVAMYEAELRRRGDDPAQAERVEAAFRWPYDTGIPRYGKSRWLAIRLGTRPENLADAINSRKLKPSQLNHDERRRLGFRMPKVVLEHFGL